MRPNWNEYFLVIAKIVSTRSTCNSRPTGAVIVKDKQILSTGYNGSMPGASHCSDDITKDGTPFCYRRFIDAPEDDKYNYCRSSHAEANAISRAARLGIALDGSTLFVTLAPCYVCLKQLANAGVKHIYYEHFYESTNKERDWHWQKIVEESPIETFEKLRVSDNTIKQIFNSLRYPTSERRLSENYEKFDSNIKGVEWETSGAFERTIRSSLLDCLTGKGNGNRIVGESINIPVDLPKNLHLEKHIREKALEFLSSVNIIKDNIMGSSDIISRIVSEVISSREFSTMTPNKYSNISASLKNGEMNLMFKIFEENIWEKLHVIIAALVLIANELSQNLIDRYDISLKYGSIILKIDKPYIKSDDKPAIKEYLTNSRPFIE